MTVYYLIGAALIIAVGRLIDRHGPTGVLAYGVCAMAGALALLGRITALWQLFAVYAARDGLAASARRASARHCCRGPPPPGAAMTLALTGASVGGMVIVPALVPASSSWASEPPWSPRARSS